MNFSTSKCFPLQNSLSFVNKLFLTIVFLYCSNTFSQNYFNNVYGTIDNESTEDLDFTNKKTIIASGQKAFPPQINTFSGYLIHTDSAGNIIWANNYTCGPSMFFRSVVATSDGGFAVAGNIYTSPGSTDLLVLKTDSAGNVLWSNTYGTPGTKEDSRKIIQTSDGGYIILGGIDGGLFGNFDLYVIKIDGFGNPQWTRSYGGNAVEIGFGIKEIPGSGYIINGLTTSFGNNSEIYLVRINLNGNVLWSRVYGETGNDSGAGLAVMTDGSFLVAAQTSNYSPANINKLNLLKIRSNGDTVWTKAFYHPLSQSGCGFAVWSINSFSNNSYLISSYYNTSPPMYFGHWMKVDSLGNPTWGRTFTTGDAFYNVKEFPDKSIVGIASTSFFGGPGGPDSYILKTDSNGMVPCIQTVDIPLPAGSKPKSNLVTTSDAPYPGITPTVVTVFTDSSRLVKSCSPLNIKKSNFEHSLVVTPNPSNGIININSDSNIAYLRIYNAFGELIHEIKTNNPYSINIDITNNSDGIYFVEIFTNTKIIRKKIIKIGS